MRALNVFGPECVKVAIPFGIERGWAERNIETRRMGHQTDRQRSDSHPVRPMWSG
jgi:hypothetical protein